MRLAVEERAAGVLDVLNIEAATMAAGGRYRRSVEIRPGVRYWSSSSERGRTDTFGVQFFGPGLALLDSLRKTLVTAGFEERNPQTGQVTFCKSVNRLPDDGFDIDSLQAIRDEIDTALTSPPGGPPRGRRTFASFIANSPLAGADLRTGPRTSIERPDAL